MTSDTSNDGPVISEDPFLKDLDPNAITAAGLVVLEGFLGRGTGDEEWRLYTNLQLDEYYALRGADIVTHRRGQDSTRVWVKRDAPLRLVRGGTAESFEAEILAGPIGRLHPDACGSDDGWVCRPEDEPLVSRKVAYAARSRKWSLSHCH